MTKYMASNFRGECLVDDDFISCLDKMNQIAVGYGIIVIVNSSYRIDANVTGAIVKPATHSNHMIGHAIDCNLELDGMYYNSQRMLNDTGTIKQFIRDVEASGMRWGGRFSTPDPVHFDDNFYWKNPTAWTEKYNKLHRTTA